MQTTYSTQHDSEAHSSTGMTLVELLLVLVLLVVIGSLVVPILSGSFASVRLRRGADQVMADFSKARAEAIASGHIYQCRFQPRGSEYRFDPWHCAEEESDLGSESASESADSWFLKKTLPEQVVFYSGKLALQEVPGEREVTSLMENEATDWSQPILFFPDGSTSSASVLLQNQRQLFQRIALRSLTGIARASDLLSAEEAERYQSR